MKSPPWKKHLSLLGVTLVSFATIFATMREMPSMETWARALSPDHFFNIAAFFLLFLVFSYFRALRWREMLSLQVVVPMLHMQAVFAWCFLLSTFIPYRMGEAARILWAKKVGTDLSLGLGSLIVERINDLVTLSLMGLVVAVLHPGAPDWLLYIGYSLSAGLLGGYLVFIVFSRPFGRLISPRLRGLKSTLWHRLAHLIETMALLGSPKILLSQFLLSALVWILVLGGYHVILSSFVPGIAWTLSMAVVVATSFSSVLPAAPGNLGVFEAAVVLVLSAFGQDQGTALIAGVSLHVVLLTVIALTGTAARLAIGMTELAPPSDANK